MPKPAIVIATVPGRAEILARLNVCLRRQTADHELHLLLDGGDRTTLPDDIAERATTITTVALRGTGAGARWLYASTLPAGQWVLILDDDVCEIPDDYVAASVAATQPTGGVGQWSVTASVEQTHRVRHVGGCFTTFDAQTLHGLQDSPVAQRHILSPWSGFVVNGWWAHRGTSVFVLQGRMRCRFMSADDDSALLWRRLARPRDGDNVLADLRAFWGWPTEEYARVMWPPLSPEHLARWERYKARPR